MRSEPVEINEPRIFCLECGYPLDGLPEPRCPECGAAFDPNDPDTYREDVGSLLNLYRAQGTPEAHALRDRLNEAGIPAAVMGESLHHGHGLPITTPTVWVGERYLEKARSVLAEFIAQRRHAAAEPAEDACWTCPGCGERIEDQFDVCWNCQAARPEERP
jgi:hypothetical protein